MGSRTLSRGAVLVISITLVLASGMTAASATLPGPSTTAADPWGVGSAGDTGGGVNALSEVDDTPVVRDIMFPVEGTVSYSDDFGACRGDGCSRGHEGNDLVGEKLQPLLAAADGTLTWARVDASGTSGNMVILEDVDGWEYWYIHINNDTPGTDDGANPKRWILAPGIEVGDFVEAGTHIAYMGDSGNAEETVDHVHFEMHRPDGVVVNPWHSLRIAQGLPAGDWCALPTNPPQRPDSAAGTGYWLVDGDGDVTSRGDAEHFGDAESVSHTGAVTDIASTPTGEGYWLSTTTGEVLAFGDATHHGDMSDVVLKAPIVGIDTTPGGSGYWLFAADGGVFSFGDADFHGSTGDLVLNEPIVGMAPTLTGAGYWLFASDGGVFSFGDADFYGSTGDLSLNAPVIGMVRSHAGYGYLLLGADGGTFTFGDARFYGSMPGTGRCEVPEAAALVPTLTGEGYWILTADGDVHGFGDAAEYGDAAGDSDPVAMAVLPVVADPQ